MSKLTRAKTTMAAVIVSAILATGLTGGGDQAKAQGGQCTQACQTAYAQCYKDTGSNRKVCEAQLTQCLSTCINKR